VATDHVQKRYRKCAKVFVFMMFGSVALDTCWSLRKIIVERDSPPTDPYIVDVEHQRDFDWGKMPIVSFKIVNNNTFMDHNHALLWNDTHEYEHELWRSNVPGDLDAGPQMMYSPEEVKVDFRTLRPNFGARSHTLDGIQRMPEFSMALWATTSRPHMHIYVADPDRPDDPEVRGRSAGYTPHGTCSFMHIQIEKDLVPKAGTYWGLPWEGKNVEPFYHVLLSSMSQSAAYDSDLHNECVSSRDANGNICTNADDNKCFGHMIIVIEMTSPILRTIIPRSVLARIRMLVSAKIGGYLSVVASLFFFLFIRRFPLTLTDEELVNRELTIRFLNSTVRPSQEEVNEMRMSEYTREEYEAYEEWEEDQDAEEPAESYSKLSTAELGRSPPRAT